MIMKYIDLHDDVILKYFNENAIKPQFQLFQQINFHITIKKIATQLDHHPNVGASIRIDHQNFHNRIFQIIVSFQIRKITRREMLWPTFADRFNLQIA